MDYEKIGDFISERRKAIGLTQKQLASKLHVTDKAVSKWERGLGCPDVSILGELSESLEVGIGEILNGEHDQNLKDNNKFILDAVTYSKELTENSIYNKFSKIIYIMMGFICAYLLFIGFLQFGKIMIGEKQSTNQKYQIQDVINRVNILKDRSQELKDKNIKFNTVNLGEFTQSALKYIEDSQLMKEQSHISYSSLLQIEKNIMNLSFYYNNFVFFLKELDTKNSLLYELIQNSSTLIYYSRIGELDENGHMYNLELYQYKNIFDNESKYDFYLKYINQYMYSYSQLIEIALKVGEKDA